MPIVKLKVEHHAADQGWATKRKAVCQKMRLSYARSDRGDGQNNEDEWGVLANLAYVFDGATDLSKSMIDEKTGAKWFVEKLAAGMNTLNEYADWAPLRATLRTSIRSAETDWHGTRDTPKNADLHSPSSTFIAVLDHGSKIELCALGDSRILYQTQSGTHAFGKSKIEALDDEVVAQISKLRTHDHHVSLADIRAKLSPMLIKNRKQMNRPDGYPMLSFDESALNFIERKTLLKSELTTPHILLASDGFLRICELYDHMSYDELIRLSPKALNEAFAKLRRIERSDPEAEAFPRLKQSDDATCVRITV